MALPLPSLDDRRWLDLVDEARSLIPFYAPDWTDHNLHDPGITLIELLARVTEMDCYAVDQAHEANRQRMLALVGVVPKPPRAARTALSFTLHPSSPATPLPAEIEYVTEDPFGASLPVQTLDPITVLPIELAAVQVNDGRVLQDQSASWRRGEPLFPFGEDPKPGSALYLGLRATAPLPPDSPLSLLLLVEDGDEDERSRLLLARQACLENCDAPVGIRTCESEPSLPSEAEHELVLEHPSVRLVWEYFGSDGSWHPLGQARVQDETRAFTLSGSTKLELPGTLAPKRIGGIDDELLYLRCRLAGGQYDAAPQLQALLANTVAAEQVAPAGSLAWRISPTATISGNEPEPGEHTGFDVHFDLDRTGFLYERGFDQNQGAIECELRADSSGAPLSHARIELLGHSQQVVTDRQGKATLILPHRSKEIYTLRVLAGDREYSHTVEYEPDPNKPFHLVLKLTLELWINRLAFEPERSPRFRILAYDSLAPIDLVIEAQLLGSGSGRPDQRIPLRQHPVAENEFELASLERNGWQSWHRQADFVASQRNDADFLLDALEGELRFGDGEHGRTASAGAMLLANYRVTRGSAGEFDSGKTFAWVDSPHNRALLADFALVAERFSAIANFVPASGGTDGEALDEAVGRAIDGVARTPRAITLADYERLTLETPGTRIARVKAWANRHLSFPCLQAPGVISVVVLPHLPAHRPRPTRELRRAVAAHLSSHRLVGTRVEVVEPHYTEVSVRARVRACPGVDRARLEHEIGQALDRFLHPLEGGPHNAPLPEEAYQDPEEERPEFKTQSGWPFGRDVYRSEVLQVIDEANGSDYVLSLELVSEHCKPSCNNVCIPSHGLVVAGIHEIEVV